MNRNFEEEYLKYAKSNVPDLWSRIEDAIDKIEEDNQTQPVAANPDKVISISKPVRFPSRYMGILAACACMAVVFMVTRSMSSSSAKHMESASAPAAAAAEAPAAEAPAMEEAAPAMDNEVMAEAAPAEAYEAAADDESKDYMYSVGAANSEATAAEAPEYEETADAEAYAEEETAEESLGADSYNKTAGRAGADADLIVLNVMATLKVADKGAPYDVELVITDPLESDFKKDERIEAVCNEELLTRLKDLKEGNEYSVAVTKMENGEYLILNAE